MKKLHDIKIRTAHTFANYLRSCGIAFSVYGNCDAKWNEVVIDSRAVEKGSFFIGLQGSANNGGSFLLDVLKKGACIALVEKEYVNARIIAKIKQLNATSSIAVFVVDNALISFQSCATYIRVHEARDVCIIGVTGSAGKTTTKQMIADILGAATNSGNLNTIEGLCMCLFNTQWEKVSFGVFECGISEENEMRHLVEILNPDYVVITNVGGAHLGHFSSMSSLREEKLILASKLLQSQIVWIPEEDSQLKAHTKKLFCKVKMHGPKNCNGFIDIQNKGIAGSVLQFNIKKCKNIQLHVAGKVNARNALTALQVADFFDIDRQHSKRVLESFTGVSRRYEVIHKNPVIIDDSYNASPPAMKEALLWLGDIKSFHKIIVLAGMKELDEYSNEEHQNIINVAQHVVEDSNNKVSRVNGICSKLCFICIGEEYRNIIIESQYQNNFIKVEKIQEAYNTIVKMPIFTDSIIFVKGSNAYCLDQLIKKLCNYFSKNLSKQNKNNSIRTIKSLENLGAVKNA